VHNGKYYSFAAYGPTWYLVAMDVATGQVDFDIELPDFGTKMMVYNGKLIVTCNGRSPVLCYNMSNGSLIWSLDLPYPEYEQINFNFDNTCLFKNYLLSTQNDYFLGVNLINGKVVCYKKYLDDNCQHDMGLVVNQEKRVYYTMNGNYFMAHKLPVEIRY
jgi:outer membrane protein assembly factor BamB